MLGGYLADRNNSTHKGAEWPESRSVIVTQASFFVDPVSATKFPATAFVCTTDHAERDCWFKACGSCTCPHKVKSKNMKAEKRSDPKTINSKKESAAKTESDDPDEASRAGNTFKKKGGR